VFHPIVIAHSKLSSFSPAAIDVALARIDASIALGSVAGLEIRLEAFHSVPWPDEDRAAILRIIHSPSSVSLKELGRVNGVIAARIADAVRAACIAASVPLSSLDLIASHGSFRFACDAWKFTEPCGCCFPGQTVFHDPPLSTLQLGDPSAIAVLTGITTVGDFRVADIAAHGQGAPITSTMDVLYLSPPVAAPLTTWRAVQNIGTTSYSTTFSSVNKALFSGCEGGIGNVTLIPHRLSGNSPIAFDTGPGNVFIDMAAGKVSSLVSSDGFHSYDKDGSLAAAGTVCTSLLEEMLKHPYLTAPPPKTTGREVDRVPPPSRFWECMPAHS
jgi:anhydro-N-acetylmuramic acid kinase